MDIIAYSMAKQNEKIISGFKESMNVPAVEITAEADQTEFPTNGVDVKTLKITVDDTELGSDDYTVDEDTGTITFASAPDEGAVVVIKSDYSEEFISKREFGSLEDLLAVLSDD